jgi:TDG/mug DNA glycosylase family protein
MAHKKPTQAELLAAEGKTISDVIAPHLKVLFCGINPGLYSGVTGYHFARPGNRFWPTLHRAGFTDRQLVPSEQHELLRWGYGVTNLVTRTTARADALTPDELVAGRRRLAEKVKTYQPRYVAILGVGAYRTGFGRPRAAIGPQAEPLEQAAVWVLPNPSGLNAHYTLHDLARLFAELREVVASRPD